MAEPYIPNRPIDAAGLPAVSVHSLMMATWMEHQIKSAKPRKRARLIRNMYDMADDLDMLGNVRRLKAANPAADKSIAEARRQGASTFRALAELFTRQYLEDEGR